MKLVIVADLHFISPLDPFLERRLARDFFADAWPSFKQMSKLIKKESPDLVISVGDLVDWYSDENRDMAIEFMNELQLPWLVTPGNHDFQRLVLEEESGNIIQLSAMEGYELSKLGWEKRGIELHNRFIDADGTGLLLMNSAFSNVPPDTREWLDQSLDQYKTNLLFTHVPLNVPEIREYIHSVDPRRDLTKYVQYEAPWVLNEGLAGRVQHAVTGHLHFPGEIQVGNTHMHMLGMGITRLGNHSYPPASFCTWRSDRPNRLERISV